MLRSALIDNERRDPSVRYLLATCLRHLGDCESTNELLHGMQYVVFCVLGVVVVIDRACCCSLLLLKRCFGCVGYGCNSSRFVAFEMIFNRLHVINLLYLGPGYGNRAETFLSYIHVELSR
jgi:hypothetical protein